MSRIYLTGLILFILVVPNVAGGNLNQVAVDKSAKVYNADNVISQIITEKPQTEMTEIEEIDSLYGRLRPAQIHFQPLRLLFPEGFLASGVSGDVANVAVQCGEVRRSPVERIVSF